MSADSNIYQNSFVGRSLKETLEDMKRDYQLPEDIAKRTLEIFDKVANQVIERNTEVETSRSSHAPIPTITGIERRFRFAEGGVTRRGQLGAGRRQHQDRVGLHHQCAPHDS